MTKREHFRATSAAEAATLAAVEHARDTFDAVLKMIPEDARRSDAAGHPLSFALEEAMGDVVEATRDAIYARLYRLRPDLADLAVLAVWPEEAYVPDWLDEDLRLPAVTDVPSTTREEPRR